MASLPTKNVERVAVYVRNVPHEIHDAVIIDEEINFIHAPVVVFEDKEAIAELGERYDQNIDIVVTTNVLDVN